MSYFATLRNKDPWMIGSVRCSLLLYRPVCTADFEFLNEISKLEYAMRSFPLLRFVSEC